VAASLHQLNQAADSNEEFFDRARFYFDNLAKLSVRSEHINQLRKSILDFAVRGKLVSQDPNDEPAEKLLKRIELEQTKIVQRVQKLPKITEEKLFKIPASWIWARGENTSQFIDPQPSHRTPPEYKDGIPYIGYSNIDHKKGIDLINSRKVSPKVFEEHRQRYKLKLGDFVFGKIGTLGEPFFLPEPFDYCLSANLILIQPNLSIIYPKYLAIFLESPYFLTFLDGEKTNSTHSVFGIKKARLICLPLPPHAEQQRIIARTNKLMTLCDQIENYLNIIQADSHYLLTSLLRKSL
jgi:type I restriction enzyme, S subunit